MMKKFRRITALMLTLALISALLSGCGESSTISVSVFDGLGYDLTELHVVPHDQEDWGDNVISGVLACNGAAQAVTLNAASDRLYDILAVDTNESIYSFASLPLSDGAAVNLFAAEGGIEAIITPKEGDPVAVAGKFEPSVAAPTPDDPLDASVALPGYEDLVISYPSTMQVAKSNADTRFVQLEAINASNTHNGISFNLIELQGTYDDRLSTCSTAQEALVEIVGKVCELTFPGMLVDTIGTEFFDGGTYYSALSYLWMSGEVFEEASTTPVRGVLECRYYGHTGYILAVFTLSDEAVIQTYFDISRNILDTIHFGNGWTTPDEPEVVWSDPGDYYDDTYTDWSDPGDYYDDTYTDWSDPGDYYDDTYTDWSDPGDYYDDSGW